MLNTNPFSTLAEILSPFAMQSFIIAMLVLCELFDVLVWWNSVWGGFTVKFWCGR